MDSGNNAEARPLFQAITEDGSNWLFVFQPDDGWAITRDGAHIAGGTSHQTSINMGVQKYLNFTTAAKQHVQAARTAANAEVQQ